MSRRETIARTTVRTLLKFIINMVVAEHLIPLVARQEISSKSLSFEYSAQPRLGVHNVFLKIPAREAVEKFAKSSTLVLLEPPEILRYPKSVLRRFACVIGPRFPATENLENFYQAGGLTIWRIGVDHEFGPPRVRLSSAELCSMPLPEGGQLSTVVSGKRNTFMQRRRLRLARELERTSPIFHSFGRNSRVIADKLEAHLVGAFHLAVENSSHPDYFTEKLTDGLLAGNHIFYGGHPASVTHFDSRSITLLDLRRGVNYNLGKIAERVSAPTSQEDLAARFINRKIVAERQNLHAHLARMIALRGAPGVAS